MSNKNFKIIFLNSSSFYLKIILLRKYLPPQYLLNFRYFIDGYSFSILII